MSYHRKRWHDRREKKERVLHTRVPEVLEAELKRLSRTLRLPVSNIVRAALEDVLEAAEAVGRTAQEEVEDITDRFAWLRRRSRRYEEEDEYGSRRGRRNGPDDEPIAAKPSSARVERILRGVIGFQPLKLARETHCTLCGRRMAPGGEAFMGVRDRKGPRVIVGHECLPQAQNEANRAATEQAVPEEIVPEEDKKESSHE